MLVHSLADLPPIAAGDKTVLREILNPLKHKVDCRYSLAHATLPPGGVSLLHQLKTTEVYYLLSGSGLMEIDGESQNVVAGDTVYIPPFARQRISNTGTTNLDFLCLVDPAWRPEDEVVLE